MKTEAILNFVSADPLPDKPGTVPERDDQLGYSVGQRYSSCAISYERSIWRGGVRISVLLKRRSDCISNPHVRKPELRRLPTSHSV
jgi:hypothetical protein